MYLCFSLCFVLIMSQYLSATSGLAPNFELNVFHKDLKDSAMVLYVANLEDVMQLDLMSENALSEIQSVTRHKHLSLISVVSLGKKKPG